jgi:hypothetical protein
VAGDVFGSDILEKEGFLGLAEELIKKWGSPINGGSPKMDGFCDGKCYEN